MHRTITGSQRKKNRRQDWYVPYLFVLPAVVCICLFLLTPVGMTFRNSFHFFNMMRPNAQKFIWFENYVHLFETPLFITALKNTFLYAIMFVPIVVIASFLLAMFSNQKKKGIALFRTAFFNPVLLSMTVVSILWTFIYNPTPGYGLINTLLEKIGLPSVRFLRGKDTALPSIMVMSAWQIAGYYMMIYLAGLQGVPNELYEAASIDGASRMQSVLHITIPSLHNVTVFVVLMTTMAAMKMFTPSYVMTSGGPDNSTTTLVFYIYQQGITYRNVGYASAISVVYFIIVITISTFVKRFVDKGDREEKRL